MSTPYDTQPGDDSDWRDFANCATTDPEIFTPPKGVSPKPAKRICGACEVRAECLLWALETNQKSSIYGGLAPSERRALRRRETK